MSTTTLVLQRMDNIIDYSMRSVIVAITVMASCTMLLQVVARYVFEIAISGLDEITGHTAVWLYLMGAAYGSFDRTQIKAEMIHLVIKNQRILSAVRALACAVAVVVSGYMVNWSYGYIHWSLIKKEVTPTLQVPTVIFQVAILIGALFMILYFVRETIEMLRDAIHPQKMTS
jgi:TRAP-type C4-dicarboxylate transport system permease small subunit